ncbi:MAG: RES family NAD+ phosphorylase [Ignavibacteriaceae bacterium]|jgi:uncharacterized protein YifE (UPF0438 family)
MKNCCTQCFKDYYLKETIIRFNKKKDCDYCNAKNVFVIDTNILQEYFEPFLNLYEPIKRYYTIKRKKSTNQRIWDRLAKDWNIFSNDLINTKGLLIQILDKYKKSPIFKNNVRLISSIKIPPGRTSLLENIWDEFSEELKHSNRYFPLKEVDKDKLVSLLQYLEYKIPKNKIYYRARNSFKDKKFDPSDLGKPPEDKTRNGRANPIGISYLYLASDNKTAISEIRPSLLDRITIGKFKVTSELIVIDLRYISPFSFARDEDFEYLIKDLKYLDKLGTALSKPLNPLDAELEYLPTQYLCEFIKRKDWDGVLYRSSLSGGSNLALFNDDKVECLKTFLYQVLNLSYDFKLVK